MRKMIFSLILACIIGCTKESNQIITKVELRSDFTESEFKDAIIGKWQSVFEKTGEENVKYLEFINQSKVRIILTKENINNEYNGNYSVSFHRPPMNGQDTFAEIIISTLSKEIVLSHVYFGLHNAILAEYGLLMRIDEAPCGVLERIK